MRIQSIETEGLMSYRDPQRIDIHGMSLVAVTGKNGVGKSTLIVTAVLLALYGKVPTRTIEEVITTGAPQASASVEFLLGDVLYRVGRVYPRVGSGEGFVLVADDTEPSGWRSLTEKGLREVTAYVSTLLGMSYETAAMTWVAEQGDYGNFSRALPAKRYGILSGVFGLDSYAPLAAAASVKWKAADSKVSAFDGRITEIEALLEPMMSLVEGASGAGVASDTDEELSARLEAAQADVQRATESLAELNVGDPGRKVTEARQALDLVRSKREGDLASARASHSRASAAVTAAVARAEAAGRDALARSTRATAEAAQRAVTARTAATKTVEQSKVFLAQIGVAEAALWDLNAKIETATTTAAQAHTEGEAATVQVGEHRTRHGELTAEYVTLRKSVVDAQARIATLERSAADTDHASCFTCGQGLSHEDALALIDSQKRDIAASEASKLTVKADGEAKNAEIKTWEATVAQFRASKAAAERTASETSASVARAETLIATKEDRESASAAALASLAGIDAEERASLEAAATDLAAATAALDEERLGAVGAADVELAAAAKVIAKTEVVPAAEAKLAKKFADAEALVADEAAAVETQRVSLLAELAQVRGVAQAAESERARREQIARVRVEHEGRLATIRKERAVADKDRLTHATLAKAFAPSGIPAMILGGVTEELNEAVNVSLERLSRGQLAVMLRTSRETKSGTTENKVTVYVETPDGPRAYETLSGGQRFRVDLAIRTGLSQIIARRTGTPIETFILDEGWGTLDEQGILNAVAVLGELSKDINVLTVSHIASVHDAFPNRIEVSDATGTSIAEVVAA